MRSSRSLSPGRCSSTRRSDAARGQVTLYLLVTMAPFAAPRAVHRPDARSPANWPQVHPCRDDARPRLAVLGHGRRGPAQGPAHPAALRVRRVWCCPRHTGSPAALSRRGCCPAEITLVTANARCGLASLIAAAIAAPVAVGGRRRDSRRLGVAVRNADLPGRRGAEHQAARSCRHREPGCQRCLADAPKAAAKRAHADGGRTKTLRRVGPVVGEAMRANAAVRAFSGFMVFFLAFLLRARTTSTGSDRNVALGALVAPQQRAAWQGPQLVPGCGRARRTASCSRRSPRPTLITAACAWFFGLLTALIVALVAAFGQALAKLALDSIVQREIGEEIRSSTFAVSETLHQLAWVAGGLIGVALSVTANGTVGYPSPRQPSARRCSRSSRAGATGCDSASQWVAS